MPLIFRPALKMRNTELVSYRGVAAEHTLRISHICFTFLTGCRLFAAEQSIADKAWTILQTGLRDKNAAKRAEAVSALGLIAGDKTAVAMTEHALQDSKPDVRRAAVTALGDMNWRASLPNIKALRMPKQ